MSTREHYQENLTFEEYYKDYTARLTESQLKFLQDYLEGVEIPLDTPLPDYIALIDRK